MCGAPVMSTMGSDPRVDIWGGLGSVKTEMTRYGDVWGVSNKLGFGDPRQR